MKIISADQVNALLDYNGLADALAEAFSGDICAPVRHHHTIERAGGTDSTLLLMPAWTNFSETPLSSNGYMGVKIATVSPDNNQIGKPAVMAIYLLSDGTTGEPLALIDGQSLTLWRTATASALAGRYLAPKNAAHLVMIGAGKLAPHLIRAHASMHPITRVTVWNRNIEHANTLADSLSAEAFDVCVSDDRAAAIAEADIICAATISSVPLIEGPWLKPGTHVDLVGAFTPQLRESDDETIRRATLFVDTFGGALKEGGDIVQPLQSGLITRSDIVADLAMLCKGEHGGRRDQDEITLFKSTGASIEDFAAGCLVWNRFKKNAS